MLYLYRITVWQNVTSIHEKTLSGLLAVTVGARWSSPAPAHSAPLSLLTSERINWKQRALGEIQDGGGVSGSYTNPPSLDQSGIINN